MRSARVDRALSAFLLSAVCAAPAAAVTCAAGATTLCLQQNRFAVAATWTTADHRHGDGRALPFTPEAGFFWFFDPENIELVVKVLDACSFSTPHFWVFAGGLTDVAVTLTVTDTATGRVRTYSNPGGTPFPPLQDTAAFATCAGAEPPGAILVADAPGDDWSLPAAVATSANSGFFSEQRDPAFHIDTGSVDFTWRQLQPAKGSFSTTTRDRVYDLGFGSWSEQLAAPDPFWLRLWVSGADWAPAWAQQECKVAAVADGYEGDPQLPIWNTCLWRHAKALFREVLLTRNLRADPRLRFVYVPGAFTWCEFDFDIPSAAAAAGQLSFAQFEGWFQPAMADLVAIMNGDNTDPADDYAWKLVYTGEDYPFAPWGTQDDLFARDAVAKGMGIRTGITEEFNFHLGQTPAYGSTIAANGHLVTDESWPALDGQRVLATENECFDDCGFHTIDPYYAVKMANLKALQLRMNWIYVVPQTSYMVQYPEFWEWVRHELGQTVATAPDAWAALREAEDRYWLTDASLSWNGKPWIKNLERWLRQLDVAPGGITGRGSDVRVHEVSAENGTAYEGRRVDPAQGNDAIYLAVDDAFLVGGAPPFAIKVTYLDTGGGALTLELPTATGLLLAPAVTKRNTGAWRTATWRVSGALLDGSLPGGADLRLRALGGQPLEVRFVRLIKTLG